MRYLIGPISASRARDLLPDAVRSGDCVPFDRSGDGVVVVGPADTWAAVEARLPDGWRPDLVAVCGARSLLPEAVWSAPVPIALLAPDWERLWHHYRAHAEWADVIATDPPGVARLRAAGIRSAQPIDLGGLPRAAFEPTASGEPRATDLLVVCGPPPLWFDPQAALLTRLARLGERWKVEFCSGEPDAPLRARMRHARLMLPLGSPAHRVRAEREAAAAGAAVVRLDDAPAGVPGGARVVTADLERGLGELLGDEGGRRAAVAAVTAALPDVSFEALWGLFLAELKPRWDELVGRAGARRPPARDDALALRCHQALNTDTGTDPTLMRDLQQVARRPTPPPDLVTALAALAARDAGPGGLTRATEALRALTAAYPGNIAAGADLAECLAAAGQVIPALDQARRTLVAEAQAEGRMLPAAGDALFFPGSFDVTRAAWERAGWEHAGHPAHEAVAKHALVRARLHRLIAARTGDLVHHYEAHRAAPEAGGAAALGVALANAGHDDAACRYLAQAHAATPLEAEAARRYHAALLNTGRLPIARSLAWDLRRLSAAFPDRFRAEPWFADAPRPNDNLASIVVPCFNECAYTRLCLESVLRHTRGPYELIVIDNGSTDDTPVYLATLPGRPGPERVRVVRNATNRGFPPACNQGFAAAAGRYIVLLNNDTIVTPGWLDGLVARAADPTRNVGLVGPVSNYAPDAQHVAPEYADPAGLGAFAARRAGAWAGRTLVAQRLTGFCLLVRRDVLERIGGLDERYGIGFFDDDDLCFRAADAGFGLVIAQDVFVHHFGNRTFRAMGVDSRELLQANFGLFQDKWGRDRTAGYRVPEPPMVQSDPLAPRGADRHPPEAPASTPAGASESAHAGGRARVSLSMIVRNEEENLGDCLRTAAHLFDEVVVVDTGSTDRTKEIATSFGVKLVEFPWVDSFAAARNESLRHCTGDWVMWLDADDRLDAENRERLRAVLAGLGSEVAAYAVKVRSVVDGGRSVRLLDQVRLFPRRPDVWWRYRIHEQILPAVADAGGGTRWADVVVDHVGYQDGSLRQKKLERNLRLIELELAEQPNDPFTLFNYGRTLLDLDRTAEALPVFQKSLAGSDAGLSIVRKLYPLIAQTLQQLGHRAEALWVCREGYERFPQDAELLFQEAQLHWEARNLAAAETCLVQLLRSTPGAYFDMVDVGLRGYKSRYQLGLVYHAQGRLAEAEAQWRSAIADRSDYTPARLALVDHYLAQQRWEECERSAREVAEHAPELAEGLLLQPQIALAQGDYQAARSSLERVITKRPGELRPRVLLTHTLLREGRDWEAAEQALREVLAIDPNHAEARQNLSVLLRQQRATPPAPPPQQEVAHPKD